MDNALAVHEEMETRELPKKMKFQEGDFVEGILIGILPLTVNGKECTLYTVMQNDDSLIEFLGTWQLDKKLRITDRGHRISIKCTGEDSTVQKGENKMKLFEVKVSKDAVKGAPIIPMKRDGDPGITDADIPF